MPKKKTIHRRIMQPRTFKEAGTMVVKGWVFLCKKYTLIFAPLTLWMLFGGGIYMYNYMTTNKFQLKEATPISQLGEMKSSQFSIMPQAVAQDKTSVQIVFEGKVYGYEDTNYIVKAVAGEPILLVYDKTRHRVYQVEFDAGYSKGMGR